METYRVDGPKPARRIGMTQRGELLIAFPYDPTLVEQARQVPGRRWDKDQRVWLAPLASFPAAVALFPGFAVSERLVTAKAEAGQAEAAKTDFAGAPQPVGIAVDLYPFQRAGAAFLRTLDDGLLCDEMGLGKTLQAIAWAVRPGGGVHVVVCPASVKLTWEREIRRARPGDPVVVVNGKAQTPRPGFAGWVVVNYDLLGRELDALVKLAPKSLVLDESHYIKNVKALRTKAAAKLALACGRRLLVTGTPVLNRPVELWTSLLVLGKKREKEFYSWAKRYCGAKQVWAGHRAGMVWDFTGASNLDELHESLKPFFLRRLKRDVLPDLPEIRYADDLVAMDPAAEREYALAANNFLLWLAGEGRTASTAEHLQQMTALRQLACAAKVPALLERLDAFRAEGRKAVVFCNFLGKGIELLAAGLQTGEYVTITGGQTAEQRQLSVDRFQQNPNCLFCLVSTAAGGVGITLTAADQVLFLDLPWTPGVKAQAEARAHRIGQDRGVLVTHLLARGTIDEAMAKVLAAKARVVAQAVDGEPEAVASEAVAAEVERELLRGMEAER